MTLDDVIETFELMDEWEDRYRFLIDIGRKLDPLGEDAYVDENKVRGCTSQVWLTWEKDQDTPPRIHLRGDSDAHIVKGLVAILLLIFSGKTAAEIRATDARGILEDLGLAKALSPMRTNGLYSMVNRIGEIAAAN